VLGWVLPVLLVVITAGVAVVLLARGGDGDQPAPAFVEATGPRFESVAEMADRADLVVEGTAVALDRGRTITDPFVEDAGVVTQLVQVDVDGEDPVIVEQESALLDGTPIAVNGLAPVAVGDGGFWFLVQGESDEFPYTALVNHQGRIVVEGGVPRTVVGDPVLDADLAALGVDGLRALLTSREG
jgi:hypothetical protein